MLGINKNTLPIALAFVVLGACTLYTETGGGDLEDAGYFLDDAQSGWSWDAGPDTDAVDAGGPGGSKVPDAGGQPDAACWQIEAEALCVITTGCTPLYAGVDCTCGADSCSCADWQFQQCQ